MPVLYESGILNNFFATSNKQQVLESDVEKNTISLFASFFCINIINYHCKIVISNKQKFLKFY